MQKKSKVEHIKEESAGLRGSIVQELAEESDHVSDATTKLLKFHGTRGTTPAESGFGNGWELATSGFRSCVGGNHADGVLISGHWSLG